MIGTERGQAYTLEGVVASLVLLSAVIFALQMTAVTPLSASTSSQHLENQQEATARGILGSADESGALERAILMWNTTSSQFYNTTSDGYFRSDPPPNDFGGMLNRSFNREGIAYNVYLSYADGAEDEQRRYVYQGRPSDNAVRASRSVVLLDNQALYYHNGTRQSGTVSSERFYFDRPTRDSSVYNVVRVEVVVWRI